MKKIRLILLLSFFISALGCGEEKSDENSPFVSLDDATVTADMATMQEDMGPPEDATPPPVDSTPVVDAMPVPIDAAPPENRPPVATDDLITTLAGEAVEIPVLINDTDPDNDTLRIVEVTQGMHGVVGIVNNSNALEYTPIDAQFVGVDSLQYTVSDGNGGQDEGAVTVRIAALPTLRITSPAEGTTIMGDAVTVEFEVTGCNFTRPSNDTTGCHAHRSVDGQPWRTENERQGQYELVPFTLTPIAAGEHTITLQLIHNDSGDQGGYNPPIQHEVTIILEP